MLIDCCSSSKLVLISVSAFCTLQHPSSYSIPVLKLFRFTSPPHLHLGHVNSDVGGGRGILTELSLCYSLVLCSISAIPHCTIILSNSFRLVSTGSGFDHIGPICRSKHLCIFGLTLMYYIGTLLRHDITKN